MRYENIELNVKGRIAYIVINRPEVRNALNEQTMMEIAGALDDIKQNDEIGCIIFTGKGEKSFAAGADISQLAKKTATDALASRSMQAIYDEIESFEKPTIAAINGYALGGGCELAMACDIRIASKNAKIGLPELNLAIIPGAGGTQRLARLVGKGKALEMILLGKMLTAEEAVQSGLVSEAVDFEELAETAENYAERILTKGPLAVRMAKIAVHMGSETDMKTGLMMEKLSQAILFNSLDKTEGVQAFLEKREAKFTGE